MTRAFLEPIRFRTKRRKPFGKRWWSDERRRRRSPIRESSARRRREGLRHRRSATESALHRYRLPGRLRLLREANRSRLHLLAGHVRVALIAERTRGPVSRGRDLRGRKTFDALGT